MNEFWRLDKPAELEGTCNKKNSMAFDEDLKTVHGTNESKSSSALCPGGYKLFTKKEG